MLAERAFYCLRSNPNTPDELKICIRAARKELKYGIPILKVKNYTLEDIFERRLWMLIPFYIFRYEKELSQIDSDEERLEKLRREYERVAEMLDQECKNGRMRSVTGGHCVNCPALLWKNWRQNIKMWKRRLQKLWEERC